MIPAVGERAADQTACQHCRCKVGHVDGENDIARETKCWFDEDVDVKKDDGGADEGDGSDPGNLSCEKSLRYLGKNEFA